MDALPVQYHLEIYERTFINDPSVSLSTSAPLGSFAVGDTFDYRTFDSWDKPPGPEEEFEISAVRHIIWEIDRAHVGHKLMLCVRSRPHGEM